MRAKKGGRAALRKKPILARLDFERRYVDVPPVPAMKVNRKTTRDVGHERERCHAARGDFDLFPIAVNLQGAGTIGCNVDRQ